MFFRGTLLAIDSEIWKIIGKEIFQHLHLVFAWKWNWSSSLDDCFIFLRSTKHNRMDFCFLHLNLFFIISSLAYIIKVICWWRRRRWWWRCFAPATTNFSAMLLSFTAKINWIWRRVIDSRLRILTSFTMKVYDQIPNGWRWGIGWRWQDVKHFVN